MMDDFDFIDSLTVIDTESKEHVYCTTYKFPLHALKLKICDEKTKYFKDYDTRNLLYAYIYKNLFYYEDQALN